MNYRKTTKLLYCAPNFWKRIFLIKWNAVFNDTTKKIYNRSSIIPFTYIRYPISIYTGNKWVVRTISKWMIGYKVGEFTWNKKIALYKAKQMRKKNKKNKKK